ncbi:hypothetical protein LEM8419_03498 [Neolewinella maritima]|uniref:Phage protein n=1 Tax=Neolewinella maritima TaxID=1383882 RepID=A0ABN8FAI2_9BACT|nr:hypothetical protein [Neolewinella maritima]CAH1002626.1 hypothetical protein LEM8419_03498 [Neolewinella maritima]
MKKVSVNDYIKVKLNDEGYEHRAKVHNAYANVITRWKQRDAEYYRSKADEDGYTKFQLWSFVDEFRDYFHIGCQLAFDNELVIVENPHNYPTTPITPYALDALKTFGRERGGEYCDRWQFSIIMTARRKWSLYLFNEVDGDLNFIKDLKDMEDLRRVYHAITGRELV